MVAWKNFDDTFSRLYTIPANDWQTDGKRWHISISAQIVVYCFRFILLTCPPTYRRLSMFSSCWTVSLPGLRSGSKPCLRGATPSVDCGAFRVRPLALSCCPLTSSSWRCFLIYIHTYLHTSGLLLLGIAHTKPCIKFEVSSSSSCKDTFDRMPKIVGSRDLRHANFQGKLFLRPLGIPDRKLRTKFEGASSSSFRDIAL